MSTIFNIKTKIRRLVSKILDSNRPSSYPFITGDGFRSLAQHYFDEISDINPNDVEEKDIIFVRSDFIKIFFRDKHPKIKNSYILIPHNDDTDIDKSYARFIDEKIIHWFAQNLCFKHEKVTPLPIGIQNLRYNETGKLKYFTQKNFRKEKEYLIKYGFSMKSHPERILAEENLRNISITKKIADSTMSTKRQDEYMEIVKNSYFLASPRGRGVDCHRTWEAIYLKTIPIVTRSVSTEYFKNIGLPILLIDSWDKIADMTPEYLEREYKKMKNINTHGRPDIPEQAYMEYWQKEILKYKN